MIPVRMRDDHATETLEVVAAGHQLFRHRRPLGIGRGQAHQQRDRLDVLVNVLAEAGIEQHVALRMPHQDAAHAEGPLLGQRTAAVGHARRGLHAARRNRVQRHTLRRRRWRNLEYRLRANQRQSLR